MVQVLSWNSTDERRAVVRHAAEALAQGKLVAFPTETVYELAGYAFAPGIVDRLATGDEAEQASFRVALRTPVEARDWVPGMSLLGRRFARRCWPGPVTLVFPQDPEEGVGSRLPVAVRSRLIPDNSLGLRAPAHDAIRQTLNELPGPLILAGANGPAGITTGDAVLERLGATVDILIDDGPSRYGQDATVVSVDGDEWRVLREGIVPAHTLQRLSACVVLFVCTGNTCRSPLAEGLCKKLLAERLACAPEELAQRGFVVLSAGLSALMGGAAAAEAVETARAQGVDLAGHLTQPVTDQLLAQADFIFAMTQSHLRLAEVRHPRIGVRPELLSAQGEDVADPIGGDHEVYEACARQIIAYLEERLALLTGATPSRPDGSEEPAAAKGFE